jgi:hypothetical protein
MNVTNKLYRKAFGTEVMRSPIPPIYGDQPAEIERSFMDVKLIVISRETAMAVMRENFHNCPFERGGDKSQPDRIFGRRVAYDDSLALGECLIAEEVV